MAVSKSEVSVCDAASYLVSYALEQGVIEAEDTQWAYNRILGECGQHGPQMVGEPSVPDDFDFEDALAVLAEAAVSAGRVEDSATGRDRASMGIMGAIMPRPSEVAMAFADLEKRDGAKSATDWFYDLCCDVDYVRLSAVARNVVWTHPGAWGDLRITINKSKPEKDPRDIAAAGSAQVGEAYPACQLCIQNEGYSGRPAAVGGGHPARQNLRIIPIELGGERWGLQYSPYAYFDEHCIAMSAEHRPMHIDRKTFSCLLDFVERFPHYFVGSNADLPIVGGSILSHDHFQGGLQHQLPMAHVGLAEEFALDGYPSVKAGVLKWPMTVLRLASADREELLDAAEHVLLAWREWSDPSVDVVAKTGNVPHNTITPICRMRDGKYEFDLALRCNVTSDEHPLGIFHPHADKWHVKKENIGLIEVMGLAILPPRLEVELDEGRLTKQEIGDVFAAVLEDAGVFKWDEAGRAALGRFLLAL